LTQIYNPTDKSVRYFSFVGLADFCSKDMWDTKRQIIWLVVGISFGTVILYFDAKDDFGRFDPTMFVFLEIILLLVVLVLFFLYSRRKS